MFATPQQREQNALHPSTWDDYFDERRDIRVPDTENTFRVYFAGNKGPIFFCLHGAGHSALSWALVAGLVKDTCRLVAYDCRGHGDTQTSDNGNMYGLQLAEDAVSLCNLLFEQEPNVKIIVVGHSMGGAIAVKAAATNRIKNMAAIVVIDVVEGTALAALPSMRDILDRRPTGFDSIQDAIDWSLKSGNIRNRESAQLSIPSQLIPNPNGGFLWRTDLQSTQPFWQEWFTGLSETFLNVRALKLLVLAGTDRLDKPLTIGQMQGKFQMSLLPTCGHVIQEDDPVSTSNTLLQFVHRFKL